MVESGQIGHKIDGTRLCRTSTVRQIEGENMSDHYKIIGQLDDCKPASLEAGDPEIHQLSGGA